MNAITQAGRWAGLGALFLKELALSAWTVAAAVVTGRRDFRPAIVAVPLDTRRDGAITLIADMVTLTPGTTSLHVSDDRSTLYVHAMDTPSPEATVRSIKETFETRVKEVLP